MRLHWQDNVIGRSYLDLCEHKLVENASGQEPFTRWFLRTSNTKMRFDI